MPTASTLRNRLLNKVRLRHLLVFAKTAELQSVKRAAQAVGISQPTATQVLLDLESMLEVTLFLRHSQGMSLTPAGAALMPLVRRILGLVDDTASQAAALAQGSQGIVRVAAISAAIGGAFGQAATRFADVHPEVTLQLLEANAQVQTQLIANGEIDCAICREPEVLPAGWQFTPIWKDRFAIVANRQHPLAGKKSVGMRQLLQATWLVTPISVAARQAFDENFDSQSPALRKFSITTTSPSMVMGILQRESLLSLLPYSLAGQGLASGQLVEIRGPKAFPLGPIGLLVPTQERGAAVDKLAAFLRRTRSV